MKKIIYIIFLLLTCISCYKVEIYKPELNPGFYSDECIVTDTLIFNSTIQVYPDSVKIQLLKRAWVTIDKYKVYVAQEELNIKKDTLLLLEEDIKYSPLGFKSKLIEKNKEVRDSWWFYFTPNMGLSWNTFDILFNKYIKEK